MSRQEMFVHKLLLALTTLSLCIRLVVTSDTERIHPDDIPELQVLRNFRRRNGEKMDIVYETANDYKRLAILLLRMKGGHTLAIIEKAIGPDPVDINNEVFSRWLEGKGILPVTWVTLVECIRDIGLNIVAVNIEAMYDKKVGPSTVSAMFTFDKAPKASLVGPCNSYLREKLNNGVRECRYFDSRGSPIIGIGHNLQKQGSKIQIERVGADYRDVLNGIECLNDAQIEDLFNEDMTEAVACGMTWLGDDHWSKLGTSAQSAIADMAFNMGCGGLRTFKRFREALVSNPVRFVKAVAEMKDSNWCRQVKERCYRDVQCMEQG